MSGKRGAREGSIYRRRDGYWAAALSLGGGERKVIYAKRRGDVADRLKGLLKAQRDGIALRSSDRLTVGTYLATWIEGVRPTIRASTWHRYSALVRRHLIPRLGSIAISKLQPAECATAFAAMSAAGSAPRSVVQARAVLARALREAEISGLVFRNVARLTRPPRVERREMRTLSGEEARMLLRVSEGDRFHALYAVALASGAREGELFGLKWGDVDWERGTIRIQRTLQRTVDGPSYAEPKTASSRRTVPLGPSVMDALRSHRRVQAEERLRAGLGKASDDDSVFATIAGTPLDASNFLGNEWYPLLKRARLPRIVFHACRHSAATLLLEAGVHPRAVADRLGHSTPSLVMNVYGHVTERMQREATAAIESVLGA